MDLWTFDGVYKKEKEVDKQGGLCYNKHTSNGVYFFVPVFRELPRKREAKIIP